MYLLIDPPVSVYSAPDDLRAWIAELEEIRREHETDAAAVGQIDKALQEARDWLAVKGRE